MFDRKFWQSLITVVGFLKSRAARELVPACRVYLRPDGIWVFPQNTRGSDGGIGVTVGPAEAIGHDATEQALGEAVIAAISRSRFEPWDYRSQLPDTMAPQSAGFRSYGELEKGAASLGVCRTGEGFEVSAWTAAKGGGYEPVAGGEQKCPDDPAAIGKAIRELSRLCVPRGVKRKKAAQTGIPPAAPSADPGDVPVSFGYKTSWVAARASSGQEVAAFLNLKDVVPCSWKDGLQQAYELHGIFVTPAVDGWILAVGQVPEAGQTEFLPFLEHLSERFGKAFYFGTHRVVEYQAWASAQDGEVRRAFGYVGERGEYLLNVGERTPEEKELGTGIEDPESSPDEETVLDLAGMWVLDPRELDLHTEATGPGLYGRP
ncbi:MAG TPA: hypothetical protein VK797_29820 [Tepidisphaeraceae bacterium]|jgi:hypothetical protein|nr:hypothetical protein [Tepidisphaeraceae bacterium]